MSQLSGDHIKVIASAVVNIDLSYPAFVSGVVYLGDCFGLDPERVKEIAKTSLSGQSLLKNLYKELQYEGQNTFGEDLEYEEQKKFDQVWFAPKDEPVDEGFKPVAWFKKVSRG